MRRSGRSEPSPAASSPPVRPFGRSISSPAAAAAAALNFKLMIDTTAAHPPPARPSFRGIPAARAAATAPRGCVKPGARGIAHQKAHPAHGTRIHIGRWRPGKISPGDVFKSSERARECPPLPPFLPPSSFRFDCPINYKPEVDPGAFGGNKQAANFDTRGERGETQSAMMVIADPRPTTANRSGGHPH